MEKKYTVSKSESLLLGNLNLSLYQLRVFTFFLGKVNPLSEHPERITFTVDELERLCGCSLHSTRLKKEVDRLYNLTIETFDYDEITGYHVLSSKTHLFRTCTIYQADDTNELLIVMEADNNFCQDIYNLKKYLSYSVQTSGILKFGNESAMLLYEFLLYRCKRMDRGDNCKVYTFFVGLNEFYNRLNLTNTKYYSDKNAGHEALYRRLDNWISIINQYSNITVNYEKKKKGRSHKLTGLIFTVIFKPAGELSIEDTTYKLDSVFRSLLPLQLLNSRTFNFAEIENIIARHEKTSGGNEEVGKLLIDAAYRYEQEANAVKIANPQRFYCSLLEKILEERAESYDKTEQSVYPSSDFYNSRENYFWASPLEEFHFSLTQLEHIRTLLNSIPYDALPHNRDSYEDDTDMNELQFVKEKATTMKLAAEREYISRDKRGEIRYYDYFCGILEKIRSEYCCEKNK